MPYMTEDWRKAIRHRNKLWKIFMRDRTDCNYELYKRQRNKCTSLRRKAIKEHFKKKQIAELMNNHFVKVAENAADVRESEFGKKFRESSKYFGNSLYPKTSTRKV